MVRDRDRLNLTLITSYFADVAALIRAAECVWLSDLDAEQQCRIMAGLLTATKAIAREAVRDIEKMDSVSLATLIGER